MSEPTIIIIMHQYQRTIYFCTDTKIRKIPITGTQPQKFQIPSLTSFQRNETEVDHGGIYHTLSSQYSRRHTFTIPVFSLLIMSCLDAPFEIASCQGLQVVVAGSARTPTPVPNLTLMNNDRNNYNGTMVRTNAAIFFQRI